MSWFRKLHYKSCTTYKLCEDQVYGTRWMGYIFKRWETCCLHCSHLISDNTKHIFGLILLIKYTKIENFNYAGQDYMLGGISKVICKWKGRAKDQIWFQKMVQEKLYLFIHSNLGVQTVKAPVKHPHII